MLTITGLEKRYGDLPVLGGLDLRVGDGEIVAVVGPSGCGKTTLLDIVSELIPCDGGRVDVGGARIGRVFQEDRLLPWLTVAGNIAIVGERPDGGEVAKLINLVGLSGFEAYYPAALSGGMRQRCSIARAYHYRCDLLLMDEPFKSLDYTLRMEMLAALMNMWRARRNAILFVTHDIDEALAIAARVVVLTPRPARVRSEYVLETAESPRDTDSDALAAMKRGIIELLA